MTYNEHPLEKKSEEFKMMSVDSQPRKESTKNPFEPSKDGEQIWVEESEYPPVMPVPTE